MSDPATIALVLLGAYLIGGIPFGLVIGRLRGVDLRAIGSGNIGATNAVRALGAKWGLLVFFLDVLKGVLPTYLAAQLLPEGLSNFELFVALAGAASFAGHCWPAWLKFRGGKGVATALGVGCVYSPVAGAVSLFVYLEILALTKISGLGSLVGVTVMSLFFWTRPSGEIPLEGQICITTLSLLIWWRHRSNIREIRERTRGGRAEAKIAG